MERQLTDHELDRARRNRTDAAQRFEKDAELEYALELEESDRNRYDALDPGTKLAAAYYRRDREAAEAERAGVPLPTTAEEQ